MNDTTLELKTETPNGTNTTKEDVLRYAKYAQNGEDLEKKKKKKKKKKAKTNLNSSNCTSSYLDISKGLTGFSNFGNTCYFNSGMQVLMQIPDLVDKCKKRNEYAQSIQAHNNDEHRKHEESKQKREKKRREIEAEISAKNAVKAEIEEQQKKKDKSKSKSKNQFIYVCKQCQTYLTEDMFVESKNLYTCLGKVYIANKIANVEHDLKGPSHVTSAILKFFCSTCKTYLGWNYISDIKRNKGIRSYIRQEMLFSRLKSTENNPNTKKSNKGMWQQIVNFIPNKIMAQPITIDESELPELYIPKFKEKPKWLSENNMGSAFSDLVVTVHNQSSRYNSVVSDSLKKVHSRLVALSPRLFGGNQQQDSMLAISYVLSALDEIWPLSLEMMKEEKHKLLNGQSAQKIQIRINWSQKKKINEDTDKLVIEELLKRAKNVRSPISYIFDGVRVRIETCLDCDYQLRTYEFFRELKLSVQRESKTVRLTVLIKKLFEELSVEIINDTFEVLRFKVYQHIKDKLDDSFTKSNIRFVLLQRSRPFNARLITEQDLGLPVKIPNGFMLMAFLNSSYPKEPNCILFGISTKEMSSKLSSSVPLLSLIYIDMQSSSIQSRDLIDQIKSCIPSPLSQYTCELLCNGDSEVIRDIPRFSRIIKLKKQSHKSNLHTIIGTFADSILYLKKKSPSKKLLTSDEYELMATQLAIRSKDLKTALKLTVHQKLKIMKEQLQKYSSGLNAKYLCKVACIPSNNTNINLKAALVNKINRFNKYLKCESDFIYSALNAVSSLFKKDGLLQKPGFANLSTQFPKSISECIDILQAATTHDNHNLVTMYCKTCQRKARLVEIQTQIVRAPRVMLVHIQRTDDNPSEFKKLISYPVNQVKLFDKEFQLIGVCNHLSSSVKYGHYTADVRSKHSGMWHHMNDSYCGSASANLSRSKNATVLVYKSIA